jgi:hypothetical protein
VPVFSRAVALARAAIHSPNDAVNGQPNPAKPREGLLNW